MDLSTNRTIVLAAAAHRRLSERISGLTDEQARAPSRLPGWTVGHVLTHLARNADGHSQRLEGALRGQEVRRYPGGPAQRDADIEAGAGRGGGALVADIAASDARLEAAWRACEAAGWPHPELTAGDRWPATASPIRRLREVELHHVDLSLGYQAAQWSDEYASWELLEGLDALPERLGPQQVRAVVMWLTGRAAEPGIELGDWL